MSSKTLTSPVIRNVLPDDVATILGFVRELAEYTHKLDHVSATEDQLRHALFGDSPIVYAVIAESEGEPVGFALYFFNFSTWLGKLGLYLEDLYVKPTQRGHGTGKALLLHLAHIAKARGCGRMEWSVLDWNEPAIGFYKSLGAMPLDGETVFRLSEDVLGRI